MSYSFSNLKNPKNVASGVADKVLLAPVAWFSSIKSPAPPYTNPGDEVTIWEDHELLPGKAFVEFSLPPEKNQLSGASVGDKGFNKLDIQLQISLQGSYAELHEAMKNIINTPLIALIEDSNCESLLYYQLGSDCAYAWASIQFATGNTREGNKGYQLVLSYLGGFLQFYKGLIPVSVDADDSNILDDYLLIDASSGLLINDTDLLLI